MKQSIALTPRNFVELVKSTGNIYETTVIIAKRAKQIAVKTKEELDAKLAEFISHSDNVWKSLHLMKNSLSLSSSPPKSFWLIK